jgi:mono/diheme cytochrome c family protein
MPAQVPGFSSSGEPTDMDVRFFLASFLGAIMLVAAGPSKAQEKAEEPADWNLISRGNYLARAADCMPCHTSAPDKSYAGGLRINTPFGAIYSPNITPDRETGIGTWTFEQFKNAVHSGIRADGQYLYPAMPFDAFTKITEDDLKALWAYFRSLPPIKQERRANEMMFPFNIRYGMLAWRILFFRAHWFEPDPKKSAQWNRGAYLVEALGHCGDCHTPRNIMGATIASQRFEGAQIDQWFAPNITAEALAQTNHWDKSELIDFLKKGAANNSTALGPMQEVVHDSLSFLTPGDIDAMATYLLDLTNEKNAPKPVTVDRKLRPEAEKRAAKLYADNCASCHQANGQGIAGSIPPLANNPVVVAAKPFDTLAVVLQGVPAQGDIPAMPSFAGSFSDSDVANLANYVRTSWGNKAAPNATPALVKTWRSTLALPAYASDAARRFDCPDVGQGGAASLDPSLIAALSGRLAQRSVGYATLVDMYKAQYPDAGTADIVNNLVAAYCPVVARSGGSDQAKSAALKQFALNITSYLASRSVVAEAEPDVGIVWAVPVGNSLAERDPGWQPALKCPTSDAARVPAPLITAATQIVGKTDVNFSAPTAVAQADTMLAQNPKAKPVDLANALILAFCQGVVGLAGVGDAERSGALLRYGQEVIQELQLKAEAKERPPAAKASQ